jgi:hypothetical protein
MLMYHYPFFVKSKNLVIIGVNVHDNVIFAIF